MDLTVELGLPKAIKGKSFADAAKYIENLFKGRNSGIDMSTKKTLMRRLREAQENVKKDMEVSTNQEFANGGLSRKEDYKSSENPYPSVESSDFAGGNRSYPIPTKNDAVDALRLAGLHNRSDVKTKVYDKYPSLKKELGGLVNPMQFGGDIDINKLAQSGYNPTTAEEAYTPNLSEEELQAYSQENVEKDSWLNRNKDILGNVTSLGLMAAPIIGNERALRNLKQSKPIQAQTIDQEIQPQLVNRQQIQRNLVKQLAGSRQALQESSSGNFGQYAANLQGLHSGSAQALANISLQSNLADAQEIARTEQVNLGLEQYNIGQQLRTDELNAQNQAAYEAQKSAYNQARGQNLANVGKTLWNYKQSQGYTQSMSNTLKLLGLQQKQ